MVEQLKIAELEALGKECWQRIYKEEIVPMSKERDIDPNDIVKAVQVWLNKH